MDYAQKERTVADLNTALKASEGAFLAHNLGLEAAPIGKLRREVRGAGGRFRVAKNRLVARALEGTTFESLTSQLQGPTALVYGSDPVALAKVLVGFAKENDRLKVLGGALGSQKMDAKGVEALSRLPGLNELRAKIIGLLQAPATKVAGVLQAPAGQLARVVHAHATKNA